MVSEPYYHAKKFFKENLSAKEMRKNEMLIEIFWGLSILKWRKVIMYEFWHDYVKPKYGEKVKVSYMDTTKFHCIYKNRCYLQRYCGRCWN